MTDTNELWDLHYACVHDAYSEMRRAWGESGQTVGEIASVIGLSFDDTDKILRGRVMPDLKNMTDIAAAIGRRVRIEFVTD